MCFFQIQKHLLQDNEANLEDVDIKENMFCITATILG